MRKLLIALLLSAVFCPTATARTYYVAADGSGDYTTLAQLAAATQLPGDSGLLRRGDTWREQISVDAGNEVSRITYGAYGTGPKPRILGSVNENQVTDWVDQGSNIWKNSDAKFTVDVGNIIFDSTVYGVKKQALVQVTSENDFWYSFVDDAIYLYHAGNPALLHANIECALNWNAFGNNRDWVKYEDLDFRYWGRCITEDGGNHTIFRRIDAYWIGGADQLSDYTVRYGNAIQFWEDTDDALVEDSFFDQIYDAAMTEQGTTDGKRQTNITWRNNIAGRAEYCYETFLRGTSSVSDSIYFENNTCVNSGGGFGHNQRWDGANGSGVRFGWNPAQTTNHYVRNNIFDGATERCILYQNAGDVSDFNLNNNVYNCTNIGTVVSTNYTTLSAWRAATGQDASSQIGDPLLQSDYSVPANSPAYHTGIKLYQYFTDDFYGMKRGGWWNIGAVDDAEAGIIGVEIR